MNSKIYMKRQKTWKSHTILKERAKFKDSHYPMSRATMKLQSIRQHSIGETTGPQINGITWVFRDRVAHNSYLIFHKEAKVIQWRNKRLFSQYCLNDCMSICKKKNLYAELILFTNITQKWITELNITCKTIRLWKENKSMWPSIYWWFF